jgi:FKBP-type peptidyl-prolyl cis-trans isomerase FkpA
MRNWSRFLSVLAMGSVVSLAMSDQAEAAGAGLPKAPVTQLVTLDRSVGSGDEAKAGQQVSVHYTGWLYDPSKADGKGKKFDSSVDRGQPFAFPLGAGRVIAGWDKGVAGMKVGGKRTLVIPSDMGYGSRGAGGVIPPNATLMFDVELLGVR